MTTTVAPGYCVDEQCVCHLEARTVTLPDAPPVSEEYRKRFEGLPEGCCLRCGRHGPKPLTIVPPKVTISVEEMSAKVRATQQQHGALLQQYHDIWYTCGHTWPYTHFLGIGLMKNPNDLWIYQDIITKLKPKTIIETGTYQGGSALWFAFLLDILGIEGARVITIDLDDHRECGHPRITYIGGDSTDPELAAAVIDDIADGPVLISLDADHSAAHVLKELELYAPATEIGDWIVIEDTNIAWNDQQVGTGRWFAEGSDATEPLPVHGPLSEADAQRQLAQWRQASIEGRIWEETTLLPGDRGARGGIQDYVTKHQGEFVQDILSERYLMTCHPGGWLTRVADCSHSSDQTNDHA